jgi:hypothetical protein
MTSDVKYGISRTYARALSKRLTFLAVLLAASVVTPSAEAQTFSLLYEFKGGTDGGGPYGLVRDAAGSL